MTKIFSKRIFLNLKRNIILVFCLSFFMLMAGSLNIFAAPPTTKYSPGDTLDPSCAPGSTNCSVAIGGGMEIGGTITSATEGSVLFAGPSGVLAQDNTNFFWDDTNNRLGIGTNTPRTSLEISGDGAILATGTFGSGWAEPDLGAGTRMLWYPAKAAFRAGRVEGNQWNNSNTGLYSAAFGRGNTASGDYSFAVGGNTNASGTYASAFGDGTTASDSYAVAFGLDSIASGESSFVAGGFASEASGQYSFAMGDSSTASGYMSFAFGNSVAATNDSSFAFGSQVDATGLFSVGFGSNNTSSGSYSTVFGYNNTASGSYSTVFGRNATADSYGSFVLGRYNVGGGTAGSWVSTDSLFEVGIGTSGIAKANAFTILKNGNVGVGTATPTALFEVSGDSSINGLRLGRGPGNDSTNTIFGYQAFNVNSSGFNNVAIGYQSLYANDYGESNVSIGYEALRNGTGASYSVAIGDGALKQYDGQGSVAIGYRALEDSTGGTSIAIGSDALGSSLGTDNIGIGSGAGNYASGGYNVLIGDGAGGGGAFSGSNNIFIGRHAGLGWTSANNNIMIGYDIEPQDYTQDNTLNIGNLIFGTGLDGVNATLSTGNVGIGDPSPTAKFTVGNGSLFQVNSSGAITAATGISSSGTITFSTAPSTSAGTYEILTRDTTTGNVEKITAVPNSMLENSLVTFATGSSGTDVNWSGGVSLGGTTTLNIPDASTSARGLVTTGTQTFAGTKTFTTTSGTNSFKINTSGATTGYGAVTVEGDTPSTNLVFLSGSSAMAGTLFGVNRALSAQFYSNNQPIVMGTAAAYDFTLGTTATARLTIKSSGNIGIGDTSPASLFTVGSGDLFQVNSSGAIAAATGITSSGIYSLTAGTSTDSFIDLTSTGDFLIKDNGNAFVTFSDTGRMGIGSGATSPAEALLIKDSDATQTKLLVENTSTTGTPDITLYNANGGSGTNYIKYFINGSSGGYNQMSLGAAGQAGFSMGAAVTNFVIDTYNGNIVFGTNSNAAGVERMRISTGGFVSIGGDTTPDYKFDVEGDSATNYIAGFFNDGNNDNRYGILIQAGADTPSANRWIQFNDGDGTDQGSVCYTGGQANICAPSDLRLKQNIVDTDIGLNNLLNIKVRNFSYISDETNRTINGFIAQELYEAYPNAVSIPSDPNEMWKVSYSQLTPLIVKSIQDLNIKLEPLTSLDQSNPNSLASLVKKFLADAGNGVETLYAKTIKSDKVETKEICVGSICVDEQDFINVFGGQNLNNQPVQNENTVEQEDNNSTTDLITTQDESLQNQTVSDSILTTE